MAEPSARPLRVIQWSTGNAGSKALRGILRHPGLELVGVHAHSPAKRGRDAALLCGWPEKTGVLASDDSEALLALGADCVVYTAQGETRIQDALADLCRILASGADVVSTSLVSLCYPPAASRKLTEKLKEACAAGGSTLYTSGFDPGWSGDVIPLALAACCERVDRVKVTEVMDYSTYPDADFTGVFFGFGKPLDFDAPLLRPGMLRGGWGCMLHLVADALGVKLDEIRELHERRPAPESFECAMGRIEKGSCAGLRFELQGIADGAPAVVAAHANRLHPEVGPDWEHLAPGKGSGYQIEVTGSPSFRCEIEPVGEDGDHNTAGITGTAMRVVNAIPAVVAAPPGLVSTLDLPLFSARGLFRRPGAAMP